MQAALPASAAVVLAAAPATYAESPPQVRSSAATADPAAFTKLLRSKAQAATQPVRTAAAGSAETLAIPLPAVRAMPGVQNLSEPQVAEPLPPVSNTPPLNEVPQAAPAAAAQTAEPQTTNAMPQPHSSVAPARPMNAGPSVWEQEEYNRRLAAVLSGTDYSANNSVRDHAHRQAAQFQGQNRTLVRYWHEESVRFQHNNRGVVRGTVRGIKQHGPQFSTFEYAYDEGDLYNTRPIVAALGPVRQAGATSDESTAETSERLTRDMTSITPTLSYALRGIDERQLPDEFFERMDNGDYVARANAPTVLQWAPTNLWHHPLYFEDPALERYGHTYHPLVQPFASSGRFAVQLVGLPYQMALHPIHAKEYTLGYYRPGEYAPKLHYQIPFNTEAALVQAAAVTGFLFIFP
jgi:hypothetical protein